MAGDGGDVSWVRRPPVVHDESGDPRSEGQRGFGRRRLVVAEAHRHKVNREPATLLLDQAAAFTSLSRMYL